MAVNRRLTIFAFIAIGGVAGAAAIIASTEINRLTSADALCVSCHSMATLVADPYFQQSGHEANAVGIRVSCSDCHIPSENWFVETYGHVYQGLKDVFSEYTHNFDDPAVWQRRRIELAADVRDQMRRNDSITCRKCHDAAAIRPRTEAGRSAHATFAQGRMTCIDCHSNIVHAPAHPSQ